MKVQILNLKALGLGSLVALTLLTGCEPVPRRQLTAEEKQADMMWLYSKFGANYAPLDYKQKLYNFDFQNLKKTYLDAAAETPDNDAFYALVRQFVAEFHDAHTSVSFSASGTPGREKVAYLGFTGRREGDNYVVTELFPTIQDETTYPIVVGTVITKYNGVPLKQYAVETMTKNANLGQDDSNFTYQVNQIFTRLDLKTTLPVEKDAVLTIKDGDNEVDVTVPWVEKDLFSFRRDNVAAQEAKDKAKEEEDKGKKKDKDHEENGNNERKQSTQTVVTTVGNVQIPFSFLTFSGTAFDLKSFERQVKLSTFKDRLDSTLTAADIAGWTTQLNQVNFDSNKDMVTKLRSLPDGAVMLEEGATFPSYIFPKEVDGKTVMLGYVLLNTFSPEGGDPVAEVKATLLKMQKLGVKDLVIDTVNNGGGSLLLLMQLAQALSNKTVVQPKIQLGLNEGWLDSIEKDSMTASSDGEKVLAQRLFNEMSAYKAQGLRITPRESAYPLTTLTPFALKPNKDLKQNFNVVLLVNEMCASACDIFAGILQDNNLATLVGSRTMGAGGNVVNYFQAPNSNMDIRQTESLIVRTNGQYIENVGVSPAPENTLVVSASAAAHYEPLRDKAVEILTAKYKAPVIVPAPTPAPVPTPGPTAPVVSSLR